MKIEKAGKLITNSHDKTEYIIHIKNLKQSLNHRFVLKKIHRFIKFNQRAWMRPYIDMNTDLRKVAKNYFEKDFFKLMNNVVFGRTIDIWTLKHRYIKLITTEKIRNYLASESNCHTAKFFTENLLTKETRKFQILINNLFIQVYQYKIWLRL